MTPLFYWKNEEKGVFNFKCTSLQPITFVLAYENSGLPTAKIQGWEFAHWFSERIPRFLLKNEQMSDLLKKCCLKKSKILFYNFLSMFYIGFFFEKISLLLISSFLVSDVSELLR